MSALNPAVSSPVRQAVSSVLGISQGQQYDPLVGFINFDKVGQDDDKLIRAALLSDSSEETGKGAGVEQGTPLATYTSQGMDTNAGTALKYVINIAHATEARDHFSLSFDIDCSALDANAVRVPDEYLVSHTSAWLFMKGNGELRAVFDNGSPSIIPLYITLDDKQGTCNVLVVGDTTEVKLYVDNLLVVRSARVRGTISKYQNFYIGGLTTTTLGPHGRRISKAVLLKRAQTFPPGRLSRVGLLGTSFFSAAGPSTVISAAGQSVDWYPGNGYQLGGVTPSSPTSSISATSPSRGDTGVICQIFRQLSKAGYWPNDNANRSQSGAQLPGIIAAFDDMVALDGVSPELVIVNAGTNEATKVVPVNRSVLAANYKTLITNLEANSVKYLVIQECLSLEADPSYSDSLHRDTVDFYNQEINALPAWSLSQGYSLRIAVDPVFSSFSGHSPDLTLYQTNNVHPNSKGSSKLGVSAGRAAALML